jgi:metallo-beta-lactamase class B
VKSLAIAAGLMLVPGLVLAGEPEWSKPHAPYRITDNIYYVGTEAVGVYLITTPMGHILLDGATEKGALVVEANIKALGFKLGDVKYLIETHAHIDHVGGLARLKKDTGAIVVASAADRNALENGVHDVQTTYGVWHFPAVKVDQTIGEGGQISLGSVTLTAHMTPGHTKGCTSWTTQVTDKGVSRSVLFFGSMTTGGNVLVNNGTYPNIVADYRLSFRRLKALKADILLTNHPEFADLDAKWAAQKADKANAFVDPQALSRLIVKSEADFNAQLAKEKKP